MGLPVLFMFQLWHNTDWEHRYRYITACGPDIEGTFWLWGMELTFPKVDGELALPKGPLSFLPSALPFKSIQEIKAGADKIVTQHREEGWLE